MEETSPPGHVTWSHVHIHFQGAFFLGKFTYQSPTDAGVLWDWNHQSFGEIVWILREYSCSPHVPHHFSISPKPSKNLSNISKNVQMCIPSCGLHIKTTGLQVVMDPSWSFKVPFMIARSYTKKIRQERYVQGSSVHPIQQECDTTKYKPRISWKK